MIYYRLDVHLSLDPLKEVLNNQGKLARGRKGFYNEKFSMTNLKNLCMKASINIGLDSDKDKNGELTKALMTGTTYKIKASKIDLLDIILRNAFKNYAMNYDEENSSKDIIMDRSVKIMTQDITLKENTYGKAVPYYLNKLVFKKVEKYPIKIRTQELYNFIGGYPPMNNLIKMNKIKKLQALNNLNLYSQNEKRW